MKITIIGGGNIGGSIAGGLAAGTLVKASDLTVADCSSAALDKIGDLGRKTVVGRRGLCFVPRQARFLEADVGIGRCRCAVREIAHDAREW